MILTMPAVLLIIALVGMLLFFGPIKRLIERTKKIGRSGIETFPPDPRQAQTQRDNGDPLALPAASAEGRLRTEDVLRDFYTPLILERDAAIREDLAKLENQGDREKVLVRQLAAAHVIRDFERTYEDIFGSQIRVVALLNSAGTEGVQISEIRKHYDAAANQFPGYVHDKRGIQLRAVAGLLEKSPADQRFCQGIRDHKIRT